MPTLGQPCPPEELGHLKADWNGEHLSVGSQLLQVAPRRGQIHSSLASHLTEPCGSAGRIWTDHWTEPQARFCSNPLGWRSQPMFLGSSLSLACSLGCDGTLLLMSEAVTLLCKSR